MGFSRQIEARTEGISVREPLLYRHLDGVIADLWSAEAHKGAGGYYRSSHPRFILFFSDVSQSIRMSNTPTAAEPALRPMQQALYVPAGMPLWSRFTGTECFRHLDLYLDARRMQDMLAPQLGQSAALAALKKPVELAASDHIDMLTRMVAQELAEPRRHGLYAESLIRAIVTGMLDLSPPEQPDTPPPPQNPGLTGAQLRRLRRFFLANIHRRVSNTELATQAGLSESWFAHVFKQTTGQTPQQWQSSLRVDQAQERLRQSGESISDLAQMLGFADQAHLTRVFRQATGQPPALWRRLNKAAPDL
jgi:AraC family transcriptional regulator